MPIATHALRLLAFALGISDFADTINESHDRARQRLHDWVQWIAEAADVRAQLIAFVPFTTAGTCKKHEPKGYGSHDEKKPVLHGF